MYTRSIARNLITHAYRVRRNEIRCQTYTFGRYSYEFNVGLISRLTVRDAHGLQQGPALPPGWRLFHRIDLTEVWPIGERS